MTPYHVSRELDTNKAFLLLHSIVFIYCGILVSCLDKLYLCFSSIQIYLGYAFEFLFFHTLSSSVLLVYSALLFLRFLIFIKHGFLTDMYEMFMYLICLYIRAVVRLKYFNQLIVGL